MRGEYVNGRNKAHTLCHVHESVFNTQMFGTFNVQVVGLRILQKKPSIRLLKKDYWFLSISKDNDTQYGWAIRDHTSKQRQSTIEILTKKILPTNFKINPIEINIFEPWNSTRIKEWAKDKYWFQGFTFAPVQKADSALVWNTIKGTVDWSNQAVLDIGCHYGYFSFEASKKGARVIGVDNNCDSLRMAKTIRDNITQQDIDFCRPFKYAGKSTDIVMYLSVHHQIDPTYTDLENTIANLKYIARKYVFVELIMPPMFGETTEKEIDSIVGGTILKRYKHKVRGNRKVYIIDV